VGGEVDLVWLTLSGRLAPKESIRNWINRVYTDRTAFVETAKDHGAFLPIRAEYRGDISRINSMVEKRLVRGDHAPPRLVHDYCFTRAVDGF